MAEYFIISTEDEWVRLKSYSGTFSGKKSTLRIQLEVDNDQLSYLTSQLERFEAAQKAAAKKPRKSTKELASDPAPAQIGHTEMLALPAPKGGAS